MLRLEFILLFAMVPNDEKTDEELFTLLKESGERPFAILYNRYWDKLLQVAFYKLQSQEDAEEAVQQVFINIWNSRTHTVLKYTFRTYISAALKYAIFAKTVQRKRHVQIPIESYESDLFIDDSTRQWLDFNDVRDKLELIISQLPEKCEIVFRLSREDGLSTKNIADQLSISTKTVEAHISKALKIIKSNLNQPWILDFLLILSFYSLF
ncbi:sigma-70 family RNA polymerase sigma factor [Mucilaginibacter lappiensis]|uniref:RNA polymerase sigma-70 factor (ECF subfamily) n=1 Tax=Mucilaginibacter lappiensis TaxID=354630 RepID=A0A841JK15_9SPHI|nr:sigma-70 family RNA polymerase sigma factor [Mucilaginibacter lappiensis]MBB6130824.1 RNA polymerase sigma-70 factor (ECF subfamily) [Mucilaginibacter lappiensis]